MPQDVYNFSDLQNWRAVTADCHPPLRLAVIGDPVAHSKSPPMHDAALQQYGLDARYTRLHLRPDELAAALRLLPAADFLGANITIPHKTAILPWLDEIEPGAQQIGAVNTIRVDGEKLRGFNTDGPGLVRALRADFGVDLHDLRVLLLGAGGGAGRAIAVQCALEQCERLVLANRTVSKAQALVAELAPFFKSTRLLGPFARLEAIPLTPAALQPQLQQIDLVINASSAGLHPGDPSPLPGTLLSPHLLVYDIVYTARRSPLLAAADLAGARGANGLSMLLHQGALAFEIWFNRPAPLDVMRAALPAA